MIQPASWGSPRWKRPKLYVKKAKEAGIDAAKFQSYKAETIASKNSPSYWDLTKEPTTSQYELFKKLDGFNQEDYEELYHYCKEVGIDFMSTPFVIILQIIWRIMWIFTRFPLRILPIFHLFAILQEKENQFTSP